MLDPTLMRMLQSKNKYIDPYQAARMSGQYDSRRNMDQARNSMYYIPPTPQQQPQQEEQAGGLDIGSLMKMYQMYQGGNQGSLASFFGNGKNLSTSSTPYSSGNSIMKR